MRFSIPQTGESFVVTAEARKNGETRRAVYLFLIGEEGSLPRAPILRYVKEYRHLESVRTEESQ